MADEKIAEAANGRRIDRILPLTPYCFFLLNTQPNMLWKNVSSRRKIILYITIFSFGLFSSAIFAFSHFFLNS